MSAFVRHARTSSPDDRVTVASGAMSHRTAAALNLAGVTSERRFMVGWFKYAVAPKILVFGLPVGAAPPSDEARREHT